MILLHIYLYEPIKYTHKITLIRYIRHKRVSFHAVHEREEKIDNGGGKISRVPTVTVS